MYFFKVYYCPTYYYVCTMMDSEKEITYTTYIVVTQIVLTSEKSTSQSNDTNVLDFFHNCKQVRVKMYSMCALLIITPPKYEATSFQSPHPNASHLGR